MKDLRFDIELRWSGTGRDGVGEIHADDVSIDPSAPESMGGRGVGTNPEELLVSAVSSCYTATLFGVLRGARLPVASLAVDASGNVTGFPGKARFDRLAASPTILGGDPSRRQGGRARRPRRRRSGLAFGGMKASGVRTGPPPTPIMR